VGQRKRSAFVAQTIRRALEDERRWDDIVASLGKIEAEGHDWDSVRPERGGRSVTLTKWP